MANRNQPPAAVTPGSQPAPEGPEGAALARGESAVRWPRRDAPAGEHRSSTETLPCLPSVNSFKKLNPRIQAKNPVMFVVEVGSVVTTIEWVRALFTPSLAGDRLFVFGVAVWLWFTVLFANFAEAMAEGRGKAQADTLRRARTETLAHRFLTKGNAGAQASLAPRRLKKWRLRSCAKVIWCWSKPASSSPETAR